MPKPYTFPTLFDELLCISITDLRKLNFLEKHTIKSGTIIWRRNGEVTSQMAISTDFRGFSPTLTLDYTCNGNPYNYTINFTSMPSNLGFGELWYFLCPFTFKRCRKLHLIDERFMHRSALPSGMYSKQTQSKKYRALDKTFGAYFSADRLYGQLYKKHFKKFYAGKPTKRYLKLKRQIEQAERISHNDIEKLMVNG